MESARRTPRGRGPMRASSAAYRIMHVVVFGMVAVSFVSLFSSPLLSGGMNQIKQDFRPIAFD